MMSKQLFVRLYRLVFAILALLAIVVAFYVSAQRPTFDPVNFFSYFTVLSNLFAAGVLLYGVLYPTKKSPLLDMMRGAAALYMATTGLVYALLLSHNTGAIDPHFYLLPEVNTVLHRLLPIVIVADWLINPPQTRLKFRETLFWLSLPLIFLTYTLLRGPFVHWYPYPFLNPDLIGGYGGVFVYCLFILLSMIIAVGVITVLGNILRTRR